MEKRQKPSGSVAIFLELVFPIIFANLISSGFKLMAEGRFGIEITSPESIWMEILNWCVIYIGILIMLHISASPKTKYPLFGLVTIIIIKFIEDSNILFLKILPQITWAKTGDFLFSWLD